MGIQTSQPHAIVAVLVSGIDPNMSNEDFGKFLSDTCHINYSRIMKEPHENKAIVYFDNYRDLNDGINRLESKEHNPKDLTILQLTSTKELMQIYSKSISRSIISSGPPPFKSFLPYAETPIPEIEKTKKQVVIDLFEKKFSDIKKYQLNQKLIHYVNSTLEKDYLSYGVFQVGFTEDKKRAVGFVIGSKKASFITPIDEEYFCFKPEIIKIAKDFTKFMREKSS